MYLGDSWKGATVSERRRDNKGRLLRQGELQRSDGKSLTYHKAADWADGAIPIYYELQQECPSKSYDVPCKLHSTKGLFLFAQQFHYKKSSHETQF